MTGLKKRRLGRTGLMVTELGLGAMDTPQSPEGEATVRLALELGINFIDTAREYQGSEYLLGQTLRAVGGEGVHLSSKTFSRNRDGAQYDVDRSLRTLGVPHIDLYLLHDVSTPEKWEEVRREGGALGGLRIAQARGLIGHVGASCHDLEVAEQIIESGEFDAIMLEYSAFHPDSGPLITLARKRDMGVIVMRPLGGSGRMSSTRTRMSASPGDVFLTPSMLLRYVLSNPDISVAITGARYPSRIRENVEAASSYEPLDPATQARCEAEARKPL